MSYQECSRCKLLRKESSKALYKRISVSFNIPFICSDCTRMIACAKHPDFKPYEVKPKVKSVPKPKKVSIAHLVSAHVNELYESHGNVSITQLQMHMKLSYNDAMKLKKQIEECISER